MILQAEALERRQEASFFFHVTFSSLMLYSCISALQTYVALARKFLARQRLQRPLVGAIRRFVVGSSDHPCLTKCLADSWAGTGEKRAHQQILCLELHNSI